MNGFDGKQIDILYAKINRNKSNMDFETFLMMLHKVSEIIYSNESLEQALYCVLEKHFKPLYENIVTQTDLGDEEARFSEEIAGPCWGAVQYLHNILNKIYLAYFPAPHKQFKLKET